MNNLPGSLFDCRGLCNTHMKNKFYNNPKYHCSSALCLLALVFFSLSVPFYSIDPPPNLYCAAVVSASNQSIQITIDDSPGFEINNSAADYTHAIIDNNYSNILSNFPFYSAAITFIVRFQTFFVSTFTAE